MDSILIVASFLFSLFVIACVIFFSQMRIMLLKKEGQTARDMLDRQIKLTDAYAWEVESKRYELMQALSELKVAHENSLRINQSLEEEVVKRTSALSQQNQKIMEYHFINAHQLRAPVARILGLTSLLQQSAFAENQLILQHLTRATQELDETVHAIQQTLYSAEHSERLKSA